MGCDNHQLKLLRTFCDPFIFGWGHTLENFEFCRANYALTRNCLDATKTNGTYNFQSYSCELETEFGYTEKYPYTQHSKAYKWIKERQTLSFSIPDNFVWNFDIFHDFYPKSLVCIGKLPTSAIPPHKDFHYVPAKSNSTNGSNPASNGSSGSNPSNGSNTNSGSIPASGSNTNSGSNPSNGSNTNSGSNTSSGSNTNSGSNPSNGSNTNSGSNPSNGSNTNSGSNPSNGSSTNESPHASKTGVLPSTTTMVALPPKTSSHTTTTSVLAQKNNQSTTNVEDSTRLVTIIAGTCVILVLIPTIAIAVALIKG